jgi:hypothetical protein
MKSRVSFYVAIGLLILLLGISWFTFSTRNQQPAQTYPATINRDCAPWDGSAFTVSIPIEESVINISIYQSPDIGLPVTFSFPDNAGNVGSAFLLLPNDMPEPLRGSVAFPRVEQGSPVQGNFDLVTDKGQHLKGKFKAEWENMTVYCG